jgi:uncharacterized membrane protein
MVAPVLRRMPNFYLLVLVAAVLVITIILQNSFDTPFRLYNNDMAVPKKPGGILRFALAEGFFPIFPWLAFFSTGIVAGRWLLENSLQKVWQLGALLIGVMAVLKGLYFLNVDFTHESPWIRFFLLRTTFYPALTPITLFLIALALLFVYFFVSLEKRISFGPSNGLVCLGRASLTLLIVHVAAIREGAFYFGFWKSFSAPITLILLALLLCVCTMAAIQWQKIGFKFGAEWLIRKVAG